MVVSSRHTARWVYKIDWWLLLDFVAQSVEAIKTKRGERVVKKKRGNINSQMPGIFPTGRRDDRSLMSSLIAWRVPSYESRKQSHTHAHTSMSARKAVMNYKSSQPKNLGPRTSSHDTSVHHFAWRIDSSTAIWHKYTWNRMQHDIFHHLLYPWIPTHILLRIAHTMDINILTQSKQSREVLLCLYKAVRALFLDAHWDFYTSGLYMLSLTFFFFFFSLPHRGTENKPSQRETRPQWESFTSTRTRYR